MDQEHESTAGTSRRRFFGACALGTGAVFAGAVAGAAVAGRPASGTSSETGRSREMYRVTDHVRRFYELAKF